MTETNLPANLENEDKRCAFILPNGDQCGAFRTKTSAFCNVHAGGLKEANRRRALAAARRKEAQENLEIEYQDLQSVDGIATFLEKLVNGIMGGSVKRDKAAMVAMFMPILWKAALVRGPKAKGAGLSLTISENKKMQLQFKSPAELDQFLQANDQFSVQILEDAQKDGRLKIEKRKDKPDVIDVKVQEVVEPEKMRIPAKDIAEITEATDIPLKPAQVIDLFGSVLGGVDPGTPTGSLHDATGFGHLFEDFRTGMPEGAFCDQKKFHQPREGMPFLADIKYKCTRCGRISDKNDNEFCKGVMPDATPK